MDSAKNYLHLIKQANITGGIIMKEINIQELLEQIKHTEFPEGTCCATNYCRDCRYMEMDNDGRQEDTVVKLKVK